MKLTLVSSDDWDGLFADGKLIAEQHSIYIAEGIERLREEFGVPFTIESFEVLDANCDWLADRGDYPKNLKDVELI